jgi:hypothetical protein
MNHLDNRDPETFASATCELMDLMSKAAVVANVDGLIIRSNEHFRRMGNPDLGIFDGRIVFPDELSRRRLLDALTKVLVTKEETRIRFPLEIDSRPPVIIEVLSSNRNKSIRRLW